MKVEAGSCFRGFGFRALGVIGFGNTAVRAGSCLMYDNNRFFITRRIKCS